MEIPDEGQPARDELVINLLLAAMACPAAQRDQFVREACVGNPGLLADVQRRVEWECRLNGFLMTPVMSRERMDRPFQAGETVLGRFRIESIAGEGGMGVVYLAFDVKTQRKLALKCPLFEFRKRMPPEARASLSVTHVNVCRVFEIHTAETALGEVDFLTMEFIEGETLASRLSSGPALASEYRDTVARQICAGLGAVHEQGIIHRDMKASNVMLSQDSLGAPRAVIMDFGIAQSSEFFSSHARGTVDYVAPELWKGQPATARSDIYALGVVLHEIFSGGRRPFPPDADWHQRLHGTPPLGCIAKRRLREVVRKCLATDVEQRYADARQIGADLGSRPLRRREWIAGGIGVLGLAAAAPFVKERFWPSPVRLAILPPVIEGQVDPSDGPVMQGFLSDLAYRLKTLRNPRRALMIYKPEEVAEVKGSREGARALGATHAIAIRLRSPSPGETHIAAELFQAGSGGSIKRITATRKGVPGLLLTFQQDLVRMVIEQLNLRTDVQPRPLPESVSLNYFQGLHYIRVDFENSAKALPFFERVIAAAPQSALGYAGLAEALLNMRSLAGGKTAKDVDSRALEAIAKADELDPESAHLRLIAGRFQALAGFYQRAVDECKRAAELDPRDPEAYIKMGTYLFLTKRLAESEAALQFAVTLQPGYYKPHLDLGLLYYERRDFKKAEQEWLEAARLAPGLTLARFNLATIYQRMGRIAEAEALARECLANKRTSKVLELLGDLQEPGEAIESLKEAIRIRPVAYSMWASLATACRRTPA